MIPVIINNRDLLTWPKAMVEKIQTYEGVGDVIIVDNGSTYPPLLDWYETNPCKIHKTTNLGHAGPWISGIVESLNCEHYIVTDSDLGLDNTPSDTLLYLLDKLKSLDLDKIGLGLDWKRVTEHSRYYNHMQGYEKNRWENSRIEQDIAIDVPTDTTFALYKFHHYYIGGASTIYPYTARHYPWEFTPEEYEKDEEFKYYIKNASHSCSYKSLLGL
jgi:glycosyltransferase involved in cell wall biosynthesis